MGSSSDPDDGQATMLLLLQQQQQQQQQQNQLLNSLPLSSPLAPPHSHLHRNNLRLLQQQQQSVQSTNNGCGILIPEKYQLISRLNNGSTTGGASVVDHFVVRYDAAPASSSSPGPHQGLSMPHHSGTLSSISTNSTTNNKYEEPIFNVRSPHHLQSNQQQHPNHGPSLPQSVPLPPLHAIQYHAQQQQQPHHPPPPLPQPNQPQIAQLSQPQQHSTGTNHSSDTTVTTATVTTTSSSELSGSEPSHVDPESEPDYAEPIVELTTNSVANYRRGGGGAGSALASSHYRYQGLSQNQSPHHHPRPRAPAAGASTDNSSSEIAAKLCGKHEKFIKLTADLVKQGHYSAMPNLGVALYLTPNLLAPNSRHLSTSPENDLYLRYGIDTSTRLSGLCPLSPVVTVNFSRSSMVEPLLRPFVLVFRHCVHLRNSKLDHNLTVLWQECDISSNHQTMNKSDHTAHGAPSVGSSSSDKWIEILRYGQENLNTACYLYCDSSHCYLVTNFVGKYLLCLKNNHGHKMALTTAAAVNHNNHNNNNNDSDYYSNCHAYETNSNDSFSNDSSALLTATNSRELQLGPLGPQQLLRELDFVKLINFSVLIESPPPQRSGGFHRIKVFIYDHLPSSVLQLSSRLGSGSTRAQRTIVRLGEQNCTTLRLSAKAGGSVYFELKLPGNSSNHHSHQRQTRGAPVKRLEVPVEDLWNCGPNWMLNCLFVVGPNGTGPECTGVVNSDLIQFDENSGVDQFEEDLQEEDFEDLDDFVYDEDQIDPLLMDIDDQQQSMAADDEDQVDLEPNFEVKIWQSKSSLPQSLLTQDSSHKMSYLSNIVILNRQSLRRLKRKPLASLMQNRNRFKTSSGSGHKYRYREEWLQLFQQQTTAAGGKDLQIRTLLMHHLDQPRADQLDWRQFAAASKLDHYLPYFASQPSPTGQIFELWEARVLNEFLLAKVAIPNVDQRRSGSSGSSGTEYGAIGSSNPTSNSKALKEFYYSKLVHLLQTIKRNDLIEIILQHQC